ncbi:MAG: short-chain dehydrogenase/reductase [Actinotalea sp.]|nr:short-chain dehydrogenase/reductase [Actinotalea sp.]
MTFTRESIPDQSGRVAVVTGANGGLGLESAAALAARGAHVVMAVRDQRKAADAVARIRRETPDASLEQVALDLASLASVRAVAEEILERHRVVDLLLNNAGVMAMPERTTVDGFELQLGVDHLGHWALTALLLPAILAAPAARVVTVTSTARHFGAPLDPGDPHLRGRYDPWRAYGQAKLANYHFGLGLDRRLRAAGRPARSLVAHPGLSRTDLQNRTVREGGAGRSGGFWVRLAARTGMTPGQGALPQLRAATDPSADGGQLYGPRFVTVGPPVRLPVLRPGGDAVVATLWTVSERETGIPLRVDRA